MVTTALNPSVRPPSEFGTLRDFTGTDSTPMSRSWLKFILPWDFKSIA